MGPPRCYGEGSDLNLKIHKVEGLSQTREEESHARQPLKNEKKGKRERRRGKKIPYRYQEVTLQQKKTDFYVSQS